jgi:hypothetical protein
MKITHTDSYLDRRGNVIAGIAAVALLLLCMAGAFLAGGCASRVKNVTNLPPGVTQAEVQNWDKEIAALHKMATITSSLRQGVIGLEKANAFPDTVAYVNALRAIAKIDQLELAASDYLKQQPEYFGQPQKDKVKGILGDIAAEIQTLNVQSLAGIKNQDTAKEVNTLATELSATLNLALSFAN